MAEAIVVMAVKAVVVKNEKKTEAEQKPMELESPAGVKWSRKLSWLSNLLWGGVFLLAIEHVWHGEVVPWPPFLTAMNNPADIAPMLHEIATVGIGMAALVTAVWGAMVLAAHKKAKPASAKLRAEAKSKA
jgi:hypothetical protein